MKWFGVGMLEKRLNGFISTTVWTGLNGRAGCLMCSSGSDCCQEAECKRQPVRSLPCCTCLLSAAPGAVR